MGKGTVHTRVANAEQRAGAGYRWIITAIVILMLVSIVGAWAFFSRQPAEQSLTIGAGPYRSDSYELMQEVAEVVSRHSPWLRVRVQATRDSSQNISYLNDGRVDASTIRADTPVAENVRLVANLFPDYFQLLTRSERQIYKVTDLIGKKVAIARFGTDEFRSFWIIGDHYDLPINRVEWQAMDFETATRKLLNGDVDAIFTVRSLRDRLLLNMFEDAELKDLAIRFVPINQAEAIALKRPFLGAGIVPVGAFVGKDPTPFSDTKTATVERFLVTRRDIDDEIVRELTRILFEHRLDLTIRFALASAIREPDLSVGAGVPLHPGASQYFNRDEPSFIQENAEPLALLVTVLAMLVSSLFALRSRFDSTRKDRMDSYNYALLDIADAARETTDPARLRALKSELFSNLERAVIALDSDQVTEKGFQSFSLLWESVNEIIRDQLAGMPSTPEPSDRQQTKNQAAKG